LWSWLLGAFGKESYFVPLVALAVRVSAFPFHTPLTSDARARGELGTLMVPTATWIWAYRWIDLETITQYQVLTLGAACIPLMLAAVEPNRAAAAAYRTVGIMVWPLLVPFGATGLVGVGLAASVNFGRDAWARFAAAVAVVAPTALLLISLRGGERLTGGDLVGWAVVSMSALMLQLGTRDLPDPGTPTASCWFEPIPTVVGLAAMAHSVATSSASSVP
jgi:hypothetical protein